ncbi:feather keratin 4-like [Alligator sinensis]|uniref:Feather keratin 4-like n=1 Tax=Alligator sinensis TaxID=38654 RepID=A0A1U7SWC3_ALLSI|nr:feather keratin 4-like [Alligator sinensis]
MSFNRQLLSSRCYNPCEVTCPQPYANAWNEPCVTSCGDSRAVVYPPPVVITFPGPILSSCPQESYVGTSEPLQIGSSFLSRGSVGSGSSLGCLSPYYSQRYNKYRYDNCGSC